MKIEDIKVNDNILVLNRISNALDLYKVITIYKSENEIIFKGQRIIFNNSNKKLNYISCYDLIYESNVIGIYQEIERV